MRRNGAAKLGPIFSALHICGLRAVWIRCDRTRKGWHIVVRLSERLAPAETIALELVCGSDRRRANLDLMRLLEMRKHATEKFWRRRWHILYSEKLVSARVLRNRASKDHLRASAVRATPGIAGTLLPGMRKR